MDTINNVVSSATKLIYGEPDKSTVSGEEPLSGETGPGTATKPFDQGNQDENTSGISTSTDNTNNRGSSFQQDTKSEYQNTTGNTGSSSFGGNTGNTGSAFQNETNTTAPEHNPAATSEHPGQKQQGGDRPEEPPSSHEVSAINQKTEAAEDTQDKPSGGSSSGHHIISDQEREKLAEKGELPHDPNDHSGEPMHMHNAGAKSDPEGGEEGESMKAKTERSASVAHEGGGEHGKEKGTGEQWVKTTGVAADGGDFDVTKPGAGKEATRIMEQKGIKTDSSTIDPNAEKVVSSGGDEPKVSTMEKIKSKMHVGSSKHP